MYLYENGAHPVSMLFSGAGVPLIGMFQGDALFVGRKQKITQKAKVLYEKLESCYFLHVWTGFFFQKNRRLEIYQGGKPQTGN